MTDDNKKRGPGRPTEKRKDTILRLRIDTDTHRKLSECAAVRQVSMSELVREAIDEIFRREKERGRIKITGRWHIPSTCYFVIYSWIKVCSRSF